MATDFVPLRDYIDRLFSDHHRAHDLSERKLESRLEGMNEIRRQLDTQAATFATREGTEASIRRLDERITVLQQYRANMEGRMWAVGAAFAVLNLVIAAIGVWRSL
jgi:DNA-binding FadR family transcriptional regulator